MAFFSNIKAGTELELDNASISITDFIKVFFSLLLIGGSVFFFHIEEDLHLIDLMLVVIPGFFIYAFLPFRFRLPFLFLLNAVALVVLFGLTIGLIALLVSLLLIGITEIPIAWKYKAFLFLLVLAVLILFRVEYLQWGASSQVATIVGILFMFRMVLYLYEHKYEKKPAGIWKKINYFILLPNLIFYIFPIVDYKTFVRNYYDKPAVEHYSKGLKWMFTGVVHFLTYRILYYYLTPTTEEVTNIYGLIQYMAISYTMIIRLSGLFHFSAGVICLFGFNLPATFDNYFLATSFSDLWRRINIYWKDFVMKVFYFPIYFKFKKRNSIAVFITVLIVFFFNWFMHAYQWFWIKGHFLLKENDIIFWALLGLFVAINSVYQKNNKPQKRGRGFHFNLAFMNSAKMLGMFVLMSFLWVFWISPDISTWLGFLSKSNSVSFSEIGTITAALLAIVLLGTGAHYLYFKWADAKKKRPPLHAPSLLVVNGVLLVLVGLGNPMVSSKIAKYFNFDVEPILITKLNKADQDQLFKGYYDELMVSNNFNSRIWQMGQKSGHRDNLQAAGMLISVPNLLTKELKAGQQIIFKGKNFTTNQYGMRDKAYALEKNENDLRIALLGGSMEIGWGVDDEETYENVLERALNNSELYNDFERIEILNFSVSGINMPQHVAIMDQKVGRFQPDVLIYTAHTDEINRSLRKFAKVMKEPELMEGYPFLIELAKKLGLHSEMDNKAITERLIPHGKSLYNWGLDHIMAACKKEGITPVLVYLQSIGDDIIDVELTYIKETVESKGFYFIDLHDLFKGENTREMTTDQYDMHPNARGHQRIADQLFNIFQTDTDLQELLSLTKK